MSKKIGTLYGKLMTLIFLVITSISWNFFALLRPLHLSITSYFRKQVVAVLLQAWQRPGHIGPKAVVFKLFNERIQIQICNFVRELHKSIDMFYFIAEQSLLHKILEVLLKVCWELHKGCLRAAYGSWNHGWGLLS